MGRIALRGLAIAGRLRVAMAAAAVGRDANGMQTHVTASLGRTEAGITTADPAELLQQDDVAMDQAKAAGRNHVVRAGAATLAPAAAHAPGRAVRS